MSVTSSWRRITSGARSRKGGNGLDAALREAGRVDEDVDGRRADRRDERERLLDGP